MDTNSAQCTISSGRINHVVIIGIGVIERRNHCFYVKTAVDNYLREIAGIFPKVSFVGYLSDSTHQLNSPLDTSKIVVYPWTKKRGAFCLESLFRLLRVVDKNTAIFFQVPQTLLLPIIPWLLWKSGKFIAYVAGDWIGVAQDLRSQGKAWRVPIDNVAATLPIKHADHVLVRGHKLLMQVQPLNPHVTLSLPLTSIPLSINRSRSRIVLGEQINLLYVGKLLFAKGVGVLLDAFAQLRQIHPELQRCLHLTVVGSGEDAEALKNYASSLNLNEHVEFWGYIDQAERIEAAYHLADIQIVPSIEAEGLPRVIEEGLLHSIPIIATEIGGIPYSFAHKRELYLVRPNDSSAIANAISEIIQDTELRCKLIQAGAQYSLSLRSRGGAAKQHARYLGA